MHGELSSSQAIGLYFIIIFFLMNNMNFIENQNKEKFPLDRNGQVRKNPM
jgi:hypothetical protein